MLSRQRIWVLSLAFVFCFSIVWAEDTETRTVRVRNPQTGAIEIKEVPISTKKEESYENKSVLVEAFLVRVSTEALAELGVNPIGQSPDGISILKILACLDDPEEAEVISGAKVMSSHNQQSRVNCNDTVYLKHEQDLPVSPEAVKMMRTKVEIHPYETGKTLVVVPGIQPDGNIRVKVTFSYTGFFEKKDSTQGVPIPPDLIAYDWSGLLSVMSGKPVIASAAQNNDTVTCLILTGTIQ